MCFSYLFKIIREISYAKVNIIQLFFSKTIIEKYMHKHCKNRLYFNAEILCKLQNDIKEG